MRACPRPRASPCCRQASEGTPTGRGGWEQAAQGGTQPPSAMGWLWGRAQDAIHGSVTVGVAEAEAPGDRGGLGSKGARRTPGQTPRQHPPPPLLLWPDRQRKQETAQYQSRPSPLFRSLTSRAAWAFTCQGSPLSDRYPQRPRVGRSNGGECQGHRLRLGGEGSVRTRHTQADRGSGRQGAAAPTGVGPALSTWGPGCVWEPRAQRRPGAQCPHGPRQGRSGN